MPKCAAGIELPAFGPCPECGADENSDHCPKYAGMLEGKIAELERELGDAQSKISIYESIKELAKDAIDERQMVEKERDKYREALMRLGSVEAFDVARAVHPANDKELVMRIEYAVEVLKELAEDA